MKVAVNYPEGPDECVHIDRIENEYSRAFKQLPHCPDYSRLQEQSEYILITEKGQYYIGSILCKAD